MKKSTKFLSLINDVLSWISHLARINTISYALFMIKQAKNVLHLDYTLYRKDRDGRHGGGVDITNGDFQCV